MQSPVLVVFSLVPVLLHALVRTALLSSLTPVGILGDRYVRSGHGGTQSSPMVLHVRHRSRHSSIHAIPLQVGGVEPAVVSSGGGILGMVDSAILLPVSPVLVS